MIYYIVVIESEHPDIQDIAIGGFNGKETYVKTGFGREGLPSTARKRSKCILFSFVARKPRVACFFLFHFFVSLPRRFLPFAVRLCFFGGGATNPHTLCKGPYPTAATA